MGFSYGRSSAVRVKSKVGSSGFGFINPKSQSISNPNPLWPDGVFISQNPVMMFGDWEYLVDEDGHYIMVE